MKILIVTLTALPLVVTLFTAGCATEPPVMKVIRDRMESHPNQYRRVEIMPIWFAGSAVMDASLTTTGLTASNREVGSNLVTALTQVLADKGYEVVQGSQVLCGVEDLEAFDANTCQLFGLVRTNFVDLSQQIYANRPNLKGKSLEYQTDPCLAELRNRLGHHEADLVVLMDSKAFYETPGARSKRRKWNRTGGTVLMPFFIAFSAAGAAGGGGAPKLPLEFSPGWMEHTILIADGRTQEVLFWNGRRFPGGDARNADTLRAKLRDTLADLAELEKRK